MTSTKTKADVKIGGPYNLKQKRRKRNNVPCNYNNKEQSKALASSENIKSICNNYIISRIIMLKNDTQTCKMTSAKTEAEVKIGAPFLVHNICERVRPTLPLKVFYVRLLVMQLRPKSQLMSRSQKDCLVHWMKNLKEKKANIF